MAFPLGWTGHHFQGRFREGIHHHCLVPSPPQKKKLHKPSISRALIIVLKLINVGDHFLEENNPSAFATTKRSRRTGKDTPLKTNMCPTKKRTNWNGMFIFQASPTIHIQITSLLPLTTFFQWTHCGIKTSVGGKARPWQFPLMACFCRSIKKNKTHTKTKTHMIFVSKTYIQPSRNMELESFWIPILNPNNMKTHTHTQHWSFLEWSGMIWRINVTKQDA